MVRVLIETVCHLISPYEVYHFTMHTTGGTLFVRFTDTSGLCIHES